MAFLPDPIDFVFSLGYFSRRNNRAYETPFPSPHPVTGAHNVIQDTLIWSLACVFVFVLITTSSMPAQAESKLLSCSQAPDGQEAFRFKIDYDRSVIMWSQYGAPDETPAQISNEKVIWERPRYEPGDGTILLGARYMLDRYNGQLNIEYYCLDRDWEMCSPGNVNYCKPISDAPMF